MGSYVPNTPSQRQAMLETIGVRTVEDLFASVPREMLVGDGLKLPAGPPEHRPVDLVSLRQGGHRPPDLQLAAAGRQL